MEEKSSYYWYSRVCGSYLAELFLNKHEVYGLVRPRSRRIIEPIVNQLHLEDADLWIRILYTLISRIKPDYIFHLGTIVCSTSWVSPSVT
jgi:GDP-D-mannose dehydratase